MNYWIHPWEMIERHAKKRGDRPAFWYLRLGDLTFDEHQALTWQEVKDRVSRYASFFRSLGLKPGSKVAIKGYNGIEWILCDLAAFGCGFVTVPLFQNSHPDEIKYILEEAEVAYLFCDKKDERISVLQLSFSDIEREMQKFSKNFTWVPASPGDLATIIYTSGTLGHPKGVMHTYGNLSEAILRANRVARIHSKDVLISYLPLSHVAERVLIELGSVFTGAQVYFLDKVERLTNFLPRVRPTVFLAVPRIWDMIRFKLEKEVNTNQALQKKLARVPRIIRQRVLNFFIKRKLGLDRTRLCASGAAKISAETVQALARFGIAIHEAYGLTETLCVSSLTPLRKPIAGSCGKLYPGVEIKIVEDGEIWLKAAFHMKGYYKHPELTAEVLEEGWFKTGDIGHLNESGYLFITDRKKNLFKTSNGKYVAPLVGENLLKSNPGIQEAMVLGEERPHCVALVQLGPDVVISDVELAGHLQNVNAQLAPHEHIKTLAVIGDAWSVQTGELTASYKLKRKVILEKYKEGIASLFEARQKVVRWTRAEGVNQEEGQKRRAHSRF